MHLRNKPPQFVPVEYRAEIERMSKSALMDLAWDFAQQLAGSDNPKDIMARFAEGRSVIDAYRD